MTGMRIFPDLTLPPVTECLRRSQALAMLDAVLSPEWEDRYYSFDSRWAPGEQMASMRNGSGDHSFMLFVADGCVVKTFDHELGVDPGAGGLASQLTALIPAQYREFLTEPAFSMDAVSSIAWVDPTERQWRLALPGTPEVGRRADDLLSLLSSGDPAAYVAWAREYHEVNVPLKAVQAVFRHQPLTHELVAALNDDLTLGDVMADANEIGYPTGDA